MLRHYIVTGDAGTVLVPVRSNCVILQPTENTLNARSLTLNTDIVHNAFIFLLQLQTVIVL